MLRQGDRFRLASVPLIFNTLWGNDAPPPKVGDEGVLLHIRGDGPMCDVMLDKYGAWRTYDPTICVPMDCLVLLKPHVLSTQMNGKDYIFVVYVDDDDDAYNLADRMVSMGFVNYCNVTRPDGTPLTTIGAIS